MTSTPLPDTSTGFRHVGPAGDQTPAEVLEALRIPQEGRVFSLALPRYTGMPLFGSHPPFQVTMDRTPNGLRGDGVEPWGPHNEVNLQYMAENVSGTAHSGAHVDALAHMTIGEDDHWYGGGNAREHLGDRGPSVGDGSKLPPFIRRGVLLDVPGYLGVEALASHQPVDAEQLQAVAEHQGVTIRPGDVVRIPPGVKHWHGASPTTGMSHIAIQEAIDGNNVDWMEHVSDEQYRK